MRLTNFNVEFSCTVSRAALLTGRYAVRTGAQQPTGMTLWEVTIADALKPLGYSTALFGKWHVGGYDWLDTRAPTNQGFDEWYGIPLTSNDAQVTTTPGFDSTKTPTPYIWEGKAGQPSRRVQVFDLESRRTIDRESARRSIDFMQRNVRDKKPFFLYYPITQIHFPALAHPDFADGHQRLQPVGNQRVRQDRRGFRRVDGALPECAIDGDGSLRAPDAPAALILVIPRSEESAFSPT
jgi:arylsulfatase A-like enzyme